MQRFFFDVSTRSHIQYDYRGRELPDIEQAKRLAEMIALDVECKGENADALEVQVRDIAGQHLLSVSIQEPDLAAA